MKSKPSVLMFAGLVFLIGGAVLHTMKHGCDPDHGARDLPEMTGGYRTIAADCLWLQTNLAWESGDVVEVRRLIDCTVAADPQTPYFWLNGARILAYDFPAWRTQLDPLAPLAVQANWRMTGAREALRLLERGQQWHGKSAALYLEMANISLYALGDRHQAAKCYRLASEQADAPDYATRIGRRLQAEEITGE